MPELLEQDIEIGAREGPLEGLGGLLIALLEPQQLCSKCGEVGKVVGREHLALDDREVDLDLVEPTGVDRSVDEDEVGPSACSRAAARWPRCEEPLSTIQNTRRAERYGCWRMTWATRRSKGAMPVFRSQRPKTGTVDIPRREVGPARRREHIRARRGGGRPRSRLQRVVAQARLDAGLLVGASTNSRGTQRPALPPPLIQVENAAPP